MFFCPVCHKAVPIAPHLVGQQGVCPACGAALIAPPPGFDPYYTWLGIPPSEQPPNYYRLLGLQLFEANLQVIEHAADRQAKHLHAFKIGPHAPQSQRLLNEVATARLVLLNPASKADYDHGLHRSLAERARAAISPAVPHSPPVAAIDVQPPAMRSIRRRRPQSTLTLVVVLLGGLSGSLLGIFGVFYLTGHDLLGLSGKLRKPGAVAAVRPERTQPEQTSKEIAVHPEPIPEQDSATNKKGIGKSSSPAQPTTLAPRVEPPQSKTPDASNSKPPVTAAAQSSTLVAPPPPRSLTDLLYPHQRLGSLSAVALPAIDSTDSVALVRFAKEPHESLVLSLVDDIAEIPSGQSLELAEDPQGRGWAVNVQGESSPTFTSTIATIRRDTTELRFSWVLPVTAAPLRRKLSNCLLIIQHGPEAIHVQLRAPVVISPPTLDLNKDEQNVEIAVTEPPSLANLHIRFDHLEALPRNGKLKGGGDVASLTKVAEIDFSDMPGPVLHLRFLRPTSNKLSLRIEPQFHEAENRLFGAGGGQFELSFSRLEKYRTSLETQLAKSRASLPSVQAEVNTLSRNLSLLSNSRPTTPQQQAQLDFARKQANAAIEAGVQRVTALQLQITQMQVKLSAIPEIKAFMDSLHRKAMLRFRIYAVVSGYEFLLVDATQEQQ